MKSCFLSTAPEICLARRPFEDEMLQLTSEHIGRCQRTRKGVQGDEGGQARGYRQQNPDERSHLEHASYDYHENRYAVLGEGRDVFPDALVRIVHLETDGDMYA